MRLILQDKRDEGETENLPLCWRTEVSNSHWRMSPVSSSSLETAEVIIISPAASSTYLSFSLFFPFSSFWQRKNQKPSSGRAQPRTLDVPPTCLNGPNTSDAARVFVCLSEKSPNLPTSQPHAQHRLRLALPTGRVGDRRRAFGTAAPSQLLFWGLERCLQARREPKRG